MPVHPVSFDKTMGSLVMLGFQNGSHLDPATWGPGKPLATSVQPNLYEPVVLTRNAAYSQQEPP
jgi:hypothetical protein